MALGKRNPTGILGKCKCCPSAPLIPATSAPLTNCRNARELQAFRREKQGDWRQPLFLLCIPSRAGGTMGGSDTCSRAYVNKSGLPFRGLTLRSERKLSCVTGVESTPLQGGLE